MGKNLFLTTAFYLGGIFILPFMLQYTNNSFFSVAAVVTVWGVMYGPCFLMGIFYMVSAAQDAKVCRLLLEI
ncbi:hypothetical protein AB8P06_12390 [Chryseobacterium sp. MD-1]